MTRMMMLLSFSLLFLLNSFGCSSPCPERIFPPKLQPLTLEQAKVGQLFEVSFSAPGATADDLKFEFSGTLPGGLLFDDKTGVLSGKPNESGSFPFRIGITLESHNACAEVGDKKDYTLVVSN